MPHLEWSINDSLLSYVRTRARGIVDVRKPAFTTVTGFAFPVAEAGSDNSAIAFDGAVTLIGHGGLLHLTFAELRLESGGPGHILSISDPDDSRLRIPFAKIHGWIARERGFAATTTTLTAEGADLFFGPYTAGTVISAPTLFARSVPQPESERN